VLDGLRPIVGTTGDIVVYPSSGTGAWEAALVNSLSPGSRVVMTGAGHFVELWSALAERLGYRVQRLSSDLRRGVDADRLCDVLAADREHTIAAVCVVHNETSTGVISRLADIRPAIESAGHSALLLVDAVSSLGSVMFDHDGWGIDVTIAGSQKGLMLPPGMGFNVIGRRALAAQAAAPTPRAYWDWMPHLEANRNGSFPYTPATNMLVALDVALEMLADEGMVNVAARHERHAQATRAAVRAWGLDIMSVDEREHSPTVTAVVVNEDDADDVRTVALEQYNMSLGAGLGALARRVFRIGHLGHLGDGELIGALGGVELALRRCGLDPRPGVGAAVDVLAGAAN